MKRILKICDLYGTQFHWFFNKNPKYYTIYGGILSILTILSWIIVFIIFGYEDFKKMNPISSISNNPPLGDKTIKFGKQKLYLPWRIMDYGENFINHKGILFPKIYYFTNKYNNETGLMETHYRNLNYKLCNETSMKNLGNDFLLTSKLDKLFCIDMEDLEMGGSWNSKFINYIRLDLNLCKDGSNYNESNSNCTKREYLNSLYGENNNWFFELLYPVVQFQPNNRDVPILVLYTSYYYGLSIDSNKVDRVFLQEYIFKDEKGWFLKNHISNLTYWGISSIRSDYYTIGKRDIFRYGSTSRLYSFKLYLDYGTVFLTRKYKKIYEILSEIFPLLRAISSILSFASEIINEIKAYKKLNEYIIIGNTKNIIKSKKRNIKNLKNNKSSNNYNIIYNFKTDKKNLYESCIKKNIIINNLNDSSKIFFQNNNMNFNFVRQYTPNDLNKKYRNTINFSNNEPFEFLKQEKIKFPLIYYFYGFFLNIIFTKRKNNYLCISEKFNRSFTFFTELIDITSYISLFQQFESLKKFVFNNLRLDRTLSPRKNK